MDNITNPLVSIVFTSYNHKEYLKQALDSLINQTYSNLEIIIIDDCSTDGSQEILKQYEHHKNINLKLSTVNSGSYVKASNYGASFASGEYILFAQCDDYAEPHQVETLVKIITNNPSVGVAFSKSILVDEKGNTISDDFVGREKKFKTAVGKSGFIKGGEMKGFLSFSCVIPNLSAALIRRGLFNHINGLSDKYLVVADWEFWLDMTEVTDFYYVATPLNYFRQHGTTIRSTIKVKTQLVEIYTMFTRHISKYNLSGNVVHKMRVGSGAIWFAYFLENKKLWLKSFFEVYGTLKQTNKSVLWFLLLGFLKQIKEFYFRKVYLSGHKS